MRILFSSEDNAWEPGQNALVSGLVSTGIVTDIADILDELHSVAQHSGPYDAIVLRSARLGSRVAGILRLLRASGVNAPVIILLDHVLPETERELLNRGADDVAATTNDPRLLAARLRALQRRTLGHSSAQITCGNIVLDQGNMNVTVDGRPVPLTSRETQLLELFMLRRNRIISKDQVMHCLYSDGDYPELRIVDVYVCKIRRKLRSAGAPKVIRTVWGCGYMLEEPSAAALAATRARYEATGELPLTVSTPGTPGSGLAASDGSTLAPSM
jgi:two-component system cell cycle response regulator CtrA